jgi:hypothetical protein
MRFGHRHNPAILLVYYQAMPPLKKQQRKRARKRTARVRAKQLRRIGSRVGDDLAEAAQQMAAHLRGEIELEDVSPQQRV